MEKDDRWYFWKEYQEIQYKSFLENDDIFEKSTKRYEFLKRPYRCTKYGMDDFTFVPCDNNDIDDIQAEQWLMSFWSEAGEELPVYVEGFADVG